MTREELEFGAYVPGPIFIYADKHCQGNTQYVSWISNRNGEVVIRTFGFRKLVRGEVEVTEVMRTSPAFKGAIVKNIYYTGMAGYRAVFEAKDVKSKYTSYYGYDAKLFRSEDFGRWDFVNKPYGMTTTIINTGDLYSIPKYKYCGYIDGDLIKYLEAYNKHPEVEYFGKIKVIYKPSLLAKVKKDRGFVNFLKKNAQTVNLYGPAAAIYAYDNHIEIPKAYKEVNYKRTAMREIAQSAPAVKECGIDSLKAMEYLKGQDIGIRSYNDYLRALINIGGFDMTDTKNAFPKDFKRMHDMRIAQWDSLKAKREANAKKAFEKQFRAEAKKAAIYAWSDGEYCVVIPTKTADLRREGNMLHHCVGKMGYDARMARGETLIVFIRKADEPTKPYVTVEWKDNRVKQCYADHDSKPNDETRAFVDKWAEWMKRKTA